MTDIEQKALELMNAVRDDRGYHPLLESFSRKSAETEALCRALEAHEADKSRHAAEMREQAERFSEAAALTLRMLAPYKLAFDEAEDILSPFILAPVDPLVVEAREICARVCEGWTDIPNGRATAYRDGMHDDEADFAYALEALRKAAIVKKEAVNG